MKLDIKAKMEEKDLNRHQLSILINVGYPTISAIYNSKTTSINFEILESLCHILECTPNDIIVSDDPVVGQLLSKYKKTKHKDVDE